MPSTESQIAWSGAVLASAGMESQSASRLYCQNAQT